MKASEFTTEDNFGTHPKRPARTGSRHPRGHQPVPRYKTITAQDSDNTAESVAEGSKEKTQGIALSKAYKKDFDDKKPGHDRAETALTGTYSKTGKPGGELKKKGVAEGLNEFAPGNFDGGDDETPGSWDNFIKAFDPEIRRMGFGMDKRSSHDARIYAHPEAQKGIMVRQHPKKDNVYYKLFQFFNKGEDEVGLADLSQNGAASVLVKVEDFLNGQQGVAEGQEEKIGGRYNADEFDSMVSRLKKLAGAGPMQTVYDPDRRVYRNMPTAQQPAQQPKKALK
jgi:hypothetical protein